MSDAAVRIKQELEGVGYTPVIENHGAYPFVVVVNYNVQNGRFHGENYRLGISMDGGVMWPDYPPHFIHLCPAIEEPKDGGLVHGVYFVDDTDGVNRKWSALSRPPGPFWDNLPTKSMQGYMEHIRRFWENI